MFEQDCAYPSIYNGINIKSAGRLRRWHMIIYILSEYVTLIQNDLSYHILQDLIMHSLTSWFDDAQYVAMYVCIKNINMVVGGDNLLLHTKMEKKTP